jgi:hypothetical protein
MNGRQPIVAVIPTASTAMRHNTITSDIFKNFFIITPVSA